MKTYNPQIQVILIKSQPRTEIAPGIPVVRDRNDQSDAIDITHLLGDNSIVTTTKSTRQPSGAFSIRFADQKHEGFLESVYGLISPMDLIEIRMSHVPVTADAIPIIMRGFVTSVDRNETMAGNQPKRFVTVTGHDFAKVLQIYRVMYLIYSEQGEQAMTEFRFFHAFAPDGDMKNMTANAFVGLVIGQVINPYMANIQALAKAGSDGSRAFGSWGYKSTIEGSISPFAVSSFTDESLYNLMRIVLDIGAFNEMYVDDTESQPVLVVRPVPFKDVAGKFIQGSAESLVIPSVDIVSQHVSRSDESVANYFWVTNNRMSLMTDRGQREVAMHGGTESYVKFGHFNCSKTMYSIKKLEAETVLGEEQESFSDANRKANFEKKAEVLLDWVSRRRKLLADMNMDNTVFETGSLRLRGNEKIKAGMYLSLLRGVKQSYVGEVYAHTITHEFSVYNGFFTTVQFDRGTGYITRIQIQESPYYAEIEAQGAYE